MNFGSIGSIYVDVLFIVRWSPCDILKLREILQLGALGS